MERSVTIKVNNSEIELYFSVWAMAEINSLCKDYSLLANWLKSDDFDTALNKLNLIVTILSNSAVIKHNVRITMGLEKGEVKSLLSHSDLQNFLISENDILTCIEGIFKTINAGLAYIIPDGVSIEEKDPDLAEIEREYGKVSDDIGVTRFYQRGYSSGLNYQEINITTPGEITQMWLLNISERQGR